MSEFEGQVALVTGGAAGIGAGVARALAAAGATVVVADVDAERGQAVAGEVGGTFVRCDVRDPADSVAAVQVAVDRYGGLDLVALNAGIAGGLGFGGDGFGEGGFDLARYRMVTGINLDGVVFGVQAALPALAARGGPRPAQIIATASLAGLTGVPFDPVYAATKHAVVGLVRSLGPALAARRVRVNAVCPSFARTAIIGPIEAMLAEQGVPLLEVSDVVEAVLAIAAGEGTGEAWYVVPGRPAEPFRFRGVPGPRA